MWPIIECRSSYHHLVGPLLTFHAFNRISKQRWAIFLRWIISGNFFQDDRFLWKKNNQPGNKEVWRNDGSRDSDLTPAAAAATTATTATATKQQRQQQQQQQQQQQNSNSSNNNSNNSNNSNNRQQDLLEGPKVAFPRNQPRWSRA